jgi:two-component system, OmpR family, response regulator
MWMRTLLIESEDSVRSALVLVLQLAGFEVIAAADGKEALELLGQFHDMEVVVCDSHLFDMSGEEVAGALRRVGSQIPVVLLSRPTNGRIASTPAGVDAVLFKPFTVAELNGAIRSAIDKRQARP